MFVKRNQIIMQTRFTILLLFLASYVNGQTLTGQELLDKAIQYHDPNHNWNTFNDSLFVTMTSPNRSPRDSKISMNLPAEYFYMKATRDSITTEYTLDKGQCHITLNGQNNLDDNTLKTHNLSCDRANMYKNYYSYLYGLPMKLKDPGTIVHDTVEQKSFKGKAYLVLKITYDETVGNDTWYFYFNPETYAMEVYQFFHDKGKNDGEYILLSDEIVKSGIKMPKHRAWYYNKDDGYLGTDRLNH